MLKGAGLESCSLGQLVHYSSAMKGDPGFVRMSDNHMGFDKPANAAVIAILRNWITHEQTIQDQVTWRPPNPACIVSRGIFNEACVSPRESV